MGKQMKRIVSFFLCLVMTLSTLPLQALAADNVTVAKNEFIQVTLNNENGRFSVRTVDGQPVRKLDNDAPLTFDKDDTSFTTFRINGTEYIFGNKYTIDEKKVKSSMSYPQLIVSDDTGTQVISTTWSVEGVDITQELTVFGDTKKTDVTQSGMVMLNYVVNNKSGASVSLGSRVLLDTMIGSNDGPSYQNGTISENTQTTERTLVRGLQTGQTVDGQEITIDNLNYYDLKTFFLMRDAGSSDDPMSTNIFAYGYHNLSDSLNLVDKVVVGHWNHLANSKYEVKVDPNLDFTVDTNQYGTADSAVAYYWNDKTLPAGEARQFQVLYGLGEIIEENKAFNVTFPSPVDRLIANEEKTELLDNGVFLVTIQAEVPLESETRHSAVTCSLHLGSALRFVKTENGKV